MAALFQGKQIRTGKETEASAEERNQQGLAYALTAPPSSVLPISFSWPLEMCSYTAKSKVGHVTGPVRQR